MLRMFAIGILFSTVVLGVACSDDDTGEGTSERQEFIEDAEDRIADLRSELEELRGDLTDGDAGAEIEQQADALEGRVNDAEAELDEVRAASDDEWQALKGSVDEALGDADALIDEIGSELGID